MLCNALSSLRNHPPDDAPPITTYDFFLRSSLPSRSRPPDIILQIGELPTSKQLRAWLQTLSVPRWCLGTAGENLDPLQSHSQPLVGSLETFAAAVQQWRNTLAVSPQQLTFNHQWQQQEQQCFKRLQTTLATTPWSAPTAIAHLPACLPTNSTVMVANSLPVRWLEFFWPLNSKGHRIFVNRGANGIDGTLSTALGLAHRNPELTVLITGDLSFLHDTNGLLNWPQLQGCLTIILLYNQGGGIFELLPIATVEDVFEPYFATPQTVNFAELCHTHRLPHQVITSLSDFKAAMVSAPQVRCQVLEIPGDRQAEAQWLRQLQQQFSNTSENPRILPGG